MPPELAVRLSVGLILVGTALIPGGCSASTDGQSATTSARPCDVEGEPIDLGQYMVGTVPPSHVELSGGHYRITATGFLHDGPFDPSVGLTSVVWGPRSTPPEYDPGPGRVIGASGSLDVEESSPVVVELPEGTWWFLNSNGVRLTLEPCSPATAEVVVNG